MPHYVTARKLPSRVRRLPRSKLDVGKGKDIERFYLSFSLSAFRVNTTAKRQGRSYYLLPLLSSSVRVCYYETIFKRVFFAFPLCERRQSRDADKLRFLPSVRVYFGGDARSRNFNLRAHQNAFTPLSKCVGETNKLVTMSLVEKRARARDSTERKSERSLQSSGVRGEVI